MKYGVIVTHKNDEVLMYLDHSGRGSSTPRVTEPFEPEYIHKDRKSAEAAIKKHRKLAQTSRYTYHLIKVPGSKLPQYETYRGSQP